MGLIPGGRWLLHRCYGVSHPVLEREVFGIRFPNPIGACRRIRPQRRGGPGIRSPGFRIRGDRHRNAAPPGGQSAAAGLPPAERPRHRQSHRHCQPGSRRHGALPAPRARRVLLGCNIGKNTDTPTAQAPADYLKLFRSLYQYADYFTVNISCDKRLPRRQDLYEGVSARDPQPAVRLPPAGRATTGPSCSRSRRTSPTARSTPSRRC